MKTKNYLKKHVKRKDLYIYLMNNLEEFAEEYLENWQDRYQAKDNRPKKEK